MNERLVESVAYLKGLAEGMDINADNKEGKLILAVIDVLGQFAKAIQGLETTQDELTEYLETIDDDLSELENEMLDGKNDEDDLSESEDYENEEYLTHRFGKNFSKSEDDKGQIDKGQIPIPSLKRIIINDGDDDDNSDNEDEQDDE